MIVDCAAVIDSIEDSVETLEKHIFGDRVHRDTTQRIYDIKRRLITVKRSISPLVEVCNSLTRWDGHQLIPEEVRPYMRDVYDHEVRINETVDALRVLLSNGMGEPVSII